MPRGRTRTLMLAALFVIACLVDFEPSPAVASRSSRLVAIAAGNIVNCEYGNGAVIAIDASGTIYVDCGKSGHFARVGQVQGTPVSLSRDANTSQILIGMENGDVYAINASPPGTPYTFTLYGNVFSP